MAEDTIIPAWNAIPFTNGMEWAVGQGSRTSDYTRRLFAANLRGASSQGATHQEPRFGLSAWILSRGPGRVDTPAHATSYAGDAAAAPMCQALLQFLRVWFLTLFQKSYRRAIGASHTARDLVLALTDTTASAFATPSPPIRSSAKLRRTSFSDVTRKQGERSRFSVSSYTFHPSPPSSTSPR